MSNEIPALSNHLVYLTDQENVTYEEQNKMLFKNQNETLGFITRAKYFALNMGTKEQILEHKLNALSYFSENATYEEQNEMLFKNQNETLGFITRAKAFALNMGTKEQRLNKCYKCKEEMKLPIIGKKPSEIGLPNHEQILMELI